VSVAAVRERLQTDTPFWAGGVTRDPETGLWLRPGPDDFQGCAKVVNKARRLVPLVGHPWQLEFDAKLEEQRAAGRPMRAIILKARQLGFSTWVQAKICQRLTMFMYQQATVVAQDVDTAGKLFNMTTTMHAHLPSEAELGLGFNIKPQITGSSFSPNGRKFVSFGEASRKLREAGRGGESVLDIDTAQSAEAGSGGTRNLVHLSEVAKWPDFATQGTKSKMVSMLNSVPFEPETLVVLESTAYGLNHFYRRWISAVAGDADELTGESYIPIFVPWWRDPAYTVAFPTEGHRERFVDSIGAVDEYSPDDEVMLAEALELSAEQLLWRRMQIRTQHEGNVELFKQENPATPEEAFIGSGNPVFPGILVQKAIRAAEKEPEPVLGTIRAVEHQTRRTRGGTIEVPTRVIWVPGDQALRDEPLLRVWEHPVPEGEQAPPEASEVPATAGTLQSAHPAAEAAREAEKASELLPGQYVVGVDVAEGEANTFTEGDFHAVHVLDHVRKVQVAEYVSRIDIHKFPLWVLLVALYYNDAQLAVEVNGPGIAVIEPIQKDYRYSFCYRRRQASSTRDRPVEQVGWKTDQVTKPLMEGTFAEALEEGTHGIRSVPLARELNTYVVDDRGKHGAQPGEHDDRLMAAMIARRVAVLLQPRRRKRRKSRFAAEDELTGY
jgi:hypothetical protein